MCIPALQHAWRKLKRPQQGEMKVEYFSCFHLSHLPHLSLLPLLPLRQAGHPIPGPTSRSFGPVQVELHVTLVRRRRSAFCWEKDSWVVSLWQFAADQNTFTLTNGESPWPTHTWLSINIYSCHVLQQKIIWFIGSLQYFCQLKWDSPIITRRSGLHQFIIKSIRTWSTASEILNARASSGFPPLDYLCFVKALTTLESRLVASKRHPRIGCNCQKVKVLTLSLYFMLPSAFFIHNVFGHTSDCNTIWQALLNGNVAPKIAFICLTKTHICSIGMSLVL